jgi:predicted acylesterase/phospholipase RssA
MAVHTRAILGGVLQRLGLAAAVGLAGCTASELPRLPRTQADLINARQADEEQAEVLRRDAVLRVLTRTKAEYDAYAAGRAPAPPVMDFLILSGGGDWGAFGAGVLKGWNQVAGPLGRPRFDVVTGVSTGALIAPFAFLGDEASINQIVELYRNPRSDWFQPRSLLTFLTGGASYGDIPGLEADIRRTLDEPMMRRLVEAGREGRVLGVNTSNLDFAEMHAWDVVAEAERALKTGETERVSRILLASSAIPGAFPPREIDGDLYVDGAMTGNILYGGRISREQDFDAVWTRLYPGTPVPSSRYWVIFNNHFRPPPEVVQPNWKSVLPRSIDTASRSATVNGIRHLFALAAIARLQSRADIQVRYIAVPDDWAPPKPGLFEKESMNVLADMGERMGAEPSSWQSGSP